MLITLQREVTQAQKRVDSGKAAVDEFLAQIETLKLDHAAAVEELAVRQTKLDTAQRRRNEAEINTSKPPLAGEVATLKQQISACAPALGEAGEAILKRHGDILAQLEPEQGAMAVDVDEPGRVPADGGGGVSSNTPANSEGINSNSSNVNANRGEGVWAEKRSELKRCLEKIKSDLGANVADGAFRAFEEVIGDDNADGARRRRERSGNRSERSRSPHGAEGRDDGKKEG